MGDDKQEDVQTLDEWKTLLTKDLLALKQLEGQDAFTRMRRSMKEQEIGQHCRPGQEKVWAILISPCSKRHWDSTNGNGMPTHPKFALNTTRQTRPRQAHRPCRSKPRPTPVTVRRRDDDKKFETSPHRPLTGIAGFDRSQDHGRERRESIRPPFRLRQGEEHRYRWDEAADHKGDTNLHPLQPRIDVRVFDHPQLVMHHGLMPSVTVGRKMADDTLQEWTGEPFVLVDDLKDEAA